MGSTHVLRSISFPMISRGGFTVRAFGNWLNTGMADGNLCWENLTIPLLFKGQSMNPWAKLLSLRSRLLPGMWTRILRTWSIRGHGRTYPTSTEVSWVEVSITNQNTPVLELSHVQLSHVQLFVTPWTERSPPGSSVHGILQARILEWVASSSFRGSSRPRDQTHIFHVSCIGRRNLPLSHLGSPITTQIHGIPTRWS